MNSKRLINLSVVGLALLLAGCGSQSASKQSSSASSATTSSKSNVKVSADNLSPEQAVSLVTAYSSNRFGGEWSKVAQNAKQDGLRANLYTSDKYKLSNNGQGVVYNVATGKNAADLAYTLNTDGSVNIYKNARQGHAGTKLATVSQSQMAKYLNNHGQGQQMNDLSTNAKVVDKRNGDTSDNGGTAKTGQYGNQGEFTVPSNLRGTWYSNDYDSSATITITAHTITTTEDGDTTTIHLYKQDGDFLSGSQSEDQSIQDATKNWGSAQIMKAHGLTYVNVRGWCQTAGDGESYAFHTEEIDGQSTPILVSASGAGFWTDGVWYQSKAQAQQHADHHFDDLFYQDDEDDDD